MRDDRNSPANVCAACQACNIARANGKLEGRLRKIVGRWKPNRERLVALGRSPHVVAHIRRPQEPSPDRDSCLSQQA
jgi:hypothetical protein